MLLLITCTLLVSNNRYPLASDTDIHCLNAKRQGSSEQKDTCNGVNQYMKVLVCTTSLPMVS